MCQYEYASYGACGHSVIECREACGVTLWRAGVSGDLILCVPGVLGRSTQKFGPKQDESLQFTEFIGFSGSCNVCIKELEIQVNVRQRDDLFGYITGSDGHVSLDAVFHLQVDQLLTTFPHLLAIDQQLTQANMDLGPAVLFPETMEKFTWASLRQQQPYKVSGFWATDEGMKPVSEILQDLHCVSGLSPQDRQMFVHVLKNNLDMIEFYSDVFKRRGMPFPMFSRICACFRDKADKYGRKDGERTSSTVSNQSTPLCSEPSNYSSQSGSPGGAGETCVRSDDEDSAVSLSPTGFSQASVQTAASASQTLSDPSIIAVKARLQHQENSNQGTLISRRSKRSFSSMQEDGLENAGSNSDHQKSPSGKAITGRPVQRPRDSQPVVPSNVNSDALHIQTSTAASLSQLTVSNVDPSGATPNGTPQPPSSAQSVPIPQQAAAQHPVGQFDIAACRAMQVQARAAQAVPLQPPSTAVVQSQAAILQAAQARAAQPQPTQPQAQLVDASRAQILQAQYRRSQAPSEIAASQARASQFATGFNQIVESHGLTIQAAQEGIVQSLEEKRKAAVDGPQANSPTITQSPIQPSLVSQSLLDPILIDESTAIQTSTMTSPSPRSPPDLLATPATAYPSLSFQQPALANTEDIPGKGKGVLPHAVAKATFFVTDKEKDLAIGHLTKAWIAYRRSSEASIVKERAALWIVNFSLNFRQQWTLCTRSGGTLRHTTVAQLTKARSGVRSNNTINATFAAGAAQSQLHQGRKIVNNQTARQQHKMHVRQAQNANPNHGSAAGADQQHLPVQGEEPITTLPCSNAGDGIDSGAPMTSSAS